MNSRSERLGKCLPVDIDLLPKEVTTEQASSILGCSKDTVLKLKKAGLLEWRNAAPPESIRPIFRFTLASVMTLRTTYQVDETPIRPFREPMRHRTKTRREFKHLHLDD
jgi:hypothetical protein